MVRHSLLILFSTIIATTYGSFINVYPKFKSEIQEKCNEPVILTPLIEAGKIKEAQQLAKVDFRPFDPVQSYSGFFNVNPAYGSHEFFWYFPAINAPETAPVVLWLQGGPGASSLFGLFSENGPFYLKNGRVYLRKYSWHLNHHVIYIDNPVGTGFSFTKDGFAKNQTQVGRDLYQALLQFFTLFPNLQNNEFFATGESYGGKYVPAISYAIHEGNKNADLKINLKGFGIGNGFSDPVHQLSYGPYLYQLGLIDSNARSNFDAFEKQGVDYINAGKWVEAQQIFDSLLNGDLTPYPSLFFNLTGFTNYFNYLHPKSDPSDDNEMAKLFQKCIVRNAIHVGNLTFHDGSEVEHNMIEDMMQSVAKWVGILLSHYRGVIYNGQLDIIVAYPLTENFLNNLDFEAAEEYKTASRHQWIVDGEVAGYAKVAGNLTEVLVRDAGHMVPGDQPKWGLDLINRLTFNKPFF